MRRISVSTALTLSVIAILALLTACGDGSSSSTSYGGESSPSVTIAAPADGSEVSGPVEVRMESTGLEIEPAGEARDGAGHFHLMIDVGCVEPGSVVPFDDDHLHYGDASDTATLDLEPGEYTLCLQAGNGIHTALDLTDTVTFTVVD